MTLREENIIEIAWEHAWLLRSNAYPNPDIDSMEAKQVILQLADDFEKEHAGRRWTGDINNDYYEIISNWATKHLLAWNKGERI